MRTTRRAILQSLAASATAFAQGRCRDGYGTTGCPLTREAATAPIKPLFAPTGWKTLPSYEITWEMPDHLREAAFYTALMGWKLRRDNGNVAELQIGDGRGKAIFKKAAVPRAQVTNLCFYIGPFDAAAVRTAMDKRGLKLSPDFHIKDPDGFGVEIGNFTDANAIQQTHATPELKEPLPFPSTGWKTVWLDHISYNATNYKATASFYMNLLGWAPTYDEGSQHELMIADIGDIIIRGGNPHDPNFGKAPSARTGRPRIDHISFGITPWDTDGVKATLEKHGLRARIDTSTRDDIHVAAYKSYHTATPNGFDLQISYVTRENRLALPNAVRPK
jgi:catechol 2,3-dioxygenase-like lactoylglutathione lyase family enzyme